MICCCSLMGTKACSYCTNNPNKIPNTEFISGFDMAKSNDMTVYVYKNPPEVFIGSEKELEEKVKRAIMATGCSEAIHAVTVKTIMALFKEYKKK